MSKGCGNPDCICGKKVYLAGPITAETEEGKAAFRGAFDSAERMFEAKHPVMNPAKLPDGFTQQEYMSICMPMLMACDIVVMLPGWESSEGAVAELSLAQKLGKIVFAGEWWNE